MRIGVLAARTGMTPSRVRFYEAEGLLPPPQRRDSGYRDYDEAAVVALKVISRGRRLGYTLREIGVYLAIPHEAGRRAKLVDCIDGKLAQYDAELAQTHSRRASLQRMKASLASS